MKILLSNLFPYKNVLGCLAILTLCNSCVQYHPKPYEVPISSTWKGDAEITVTMPPQTHNSWWTIFEDTQLNTLVETAIMQNKTLEDSLLHLEEAKELYTIEAAPLFPRIDLFFSANRIHLPKSFVPQPQSFVSQQTPLAPPNLTPITNTQSTPQNQSTLQLFPELSYEIDFWGKYSQQAKAADMQIQASEEDCKIAQLLISTETAKRYFEIRTLDMEKELLQKTLLLKQREIKLLTQRVLAGIDNEDNVQSARIELTQIERALSDICALRRYAENSLAILLGINPSEMHIESSATCLHIPSIPHVLPGSILTSRPDLQRGLHIIEEKRLLVGVAKTDFFPKFEIFGYAGQMSRTRASLFKWKNHILSGTAMALAPLYNAGSIQANVQAAIVRYQQAVNNYVLDTLTAFREVEDALTAIMTSRDHTQSVHQALISQQIKTDLAIEREQSCIKNFLETVPDQIQLITAQQQYVQTQREVLLSTIDFIKSIGGCWK